ncbi:DUF4118 domain-containing protein [Streptomyces sp. JV185]|uniref:DUF4118 domain-containing protein n=1 Tax=Streptomyces sp. JV185 TaxID=858638 RepID=UPI002E79CB79|nr:DUF4118 domain-containing protein [Streptomyces sp. JV185]MEE1772251.1 DUF4118 domain-containing protein [Streptomyces sp. JV185]
MSGFPLRDRVAVAAALVCPPAVGALLVPFRTDLTSTNAALILVVAVVAVAAIGSRVAGALAALSAAVWFDFFLTVPYQRFAIDKREDIQTAVLLLVVSLVVSQLAARARRLQVVAITDAGHLAAIHDTAQLARSTTSPDAVVDHVRGELTRLLGLKGCRFEYGTLLGHPPRLEQDGDVVVGRRTWDVERRGWPQGEIELRATGNGHYYGRFMLAPAPGAEPASLQARLVAATLADQAGAAMATVGTREHG